MFENEPKSPEYLIDLYGTARCLAEGCKWEETSRIVLVVNEAGYKQDDLPDISLASLFNQYLIGECQLHHVHIGYIHNNHNVFSLLVGDTIVGRIAASSSGAVVGINRGSLEIIKQIGTMKPRTALE